MIVHHDGSYERADWHTAEFAATNYPDSYWIDETTEDGAALAAKIIELYPYYNLIVDADGVLTDVEQRDPTAEELAAAEPKKTEAQRRIDELETANAQLQSAVSQAQADNIATMTALADVYEQLLALQTGGTA